MTGDAGGCRTLLDSTLTRTQFLIGGHWIDPDGPGAIEVVDPATEEPLGVVPEGSAVDAHRAVVAASAAADDWAGRAPTERARVLRDLGGLLQDRAEELARLITAEVGSPLAFSRTQQVGLPIQVITGIADQLPSIAWEERIDRAVVTREPVGVVAAITPWNYPLHQVVAKVAAALGAGCTVVLKPSELAPFSAFVLADLVVEIGLPPGVFNLVSGYGPVVGEAIASHPLTDMVSLTGSGEAGRRVMELAAPEAKRVALELGGKSATIVLDDADVDAVVPGAVLQAFRNAGQNCSALSRLLVPRDRLARVEDLARDVADAVVVGDPTDPATDMGPLISAAHRERVRGHVNTAIAEGARLVAGGPGEPSGSGAGYFIRPTVISDVTADMQIAQNEVFGPVLAILAYDTESDAIRIANDSRYGLSGAVWSADLARAVRVARQVKTGRVVINGGPFNAIAPFGGFKQSGIGRELGAYGVEEFTQLKTLQL